MPMELQVLDWNSHKHVEGKVKLPIGIPTLSSGGLSLCVLTGVFLLYHDYQIF